MIASLPSIVGAAHQSSSRSSCREGVADRQLPASHRVWSDSLAGRISTLDIGPLLLREVAAMRGRGDPMAQVRTDRPWTVTAIFDRVVAGIIVVAWERGTTKSATQGRNSHPELPPSGGA